MCHSEKYYSRNPSSYRAPNKIRVTRNKRFIELEPIVDFASENESDDIQFMNIPHLNNKEESKEFYDVVSDKLKKRNIKLLNKGSFEEQLLSEFRRFTDGMISKMDEQNKLLREIAKKINQTTLPFQLSQILILSMNHMKMNRLMIIVILLNTKLIIQSYFMTHILSRSLRKFSFQTLQRNH